MGYPTWYPIISKRYEKKQKFIWSAYIKSGSDA
jgi:hypothetical protein